MQTQDHLRNPQLITNTLTFCKDNKFYSDGVPEVGRPVLVTS